MNQKTWIIYPPNYANNYSISPPLGALYLTSYLQHNNVNAEIADLNIIKRWKKKVVDIISEEPNFIALSSNVANFSNTLYIANLIKTYNSNIKIIVGGPHPSSIPERYLRNKNIDVVCVGEGERTLYEYVTRGENVEGLMLRKNGTLFFTGNRNLIEDVDKIPFPSLEQVDITKYSYLFQKQKPISNIITSRGCPYHCTFCLHSVYGHKWRARSPKNVVDEMKWQVNELGVKELCIWDDNFSFDLKRVEKICALIKEENLNFSWQCSSGLRVDRITKNVLKKMKDAGCYIVIIAPDTGDPYVLKKIQKSFTLEDAERAIKWCKELNLLVPLYIMMGFPFETLKNVKNSLQFIKKVKPDIISIHKFYPFPKTQIVKDYDLEFYEDKGYHTAKIGKEFQRIYIRLHLSFYLKPRILMNFIKKMGLLYVVKLAYRYLKKNFKELLRQFREKLR